ncbi:penicillin-binding protein 2 [bacterium]|nr:MAG: penicillin-binding protein 2 [bacterium]
MPSPDLNLEDILTDRAVEEDFLEIPLTDRVFKIFLTIATIIIVLIFAQLLNLAAVNGDFYARRAVANMSDVKIESAPRGIISDRFGNKLVENNQAFNVFLVPKSLPKTSGERLAIIANAAEILNLDQGEILKQLEERDWSMSDRLILKTDLSHDELVSVAAANLPGVEIDPSFKRSENIPLKFSHVIGYTGLVNKSDLSGNSNLGIDDQIGRSGLEAFYDDYLRGVNGEKMILTNAQGKTENERVIKQSVLGDDIKTFIDRDLQSYLYDRLSGALRELGRDVGVGIVMNPQNGEVLSLVNIPSFDVNHIGNYLTNKNQPLFNRAVSGIYNPGSTIKPLVATGALVEGILDPNHEIYSPGYLDVPNPYDPENPSRFLDWRPQGWVNLYSAIARSSNVYFYSVGGGFGDQKGLGIERLKKWWQKFGLDEKTNIDLVGEDTGFLPDPVWKEKTKGEPWRLGDTFNVSIGQGDFSVTPIELLNYIGAIANGGKFYEPRIMNEIKNARGDTVLKSEPSLLRDLSNEIGSVLGDVRRGMRDGVTETYGTSYLLHDLPITVAAKTGSAQVSNNTKTNAFFVGYAPFDNPEIAVLILVENAREGSLNVVPVARDIFLWYYNNRIKK